MFGLHESFVNFTLKIFVYSQPMKYKFENFIFFLDIPVSNFSVVFQDDLMVCNYYSLFHR